MNGEKKLENILKNLCPQLNNGEYIFLINNKDYSLPKESIIMSFQEEEGETLIIHKEVADNLEIVYDNTFSRITLKVHSSLESVGLTSLFSTALAEEKISCNVIAGYYHDHIFIPVLLHEKALKVLQNLGN